MAHDVRAVANALIEKSMRDNRPLTPMQIIKLAYICHGWMLGLYHRPLINNTVEAWRYGPVVGELYQALKWYGSGYVSQPIGMAPEFEQLDPQETDLIEQVWEKYGQLSGIALSRLTHAAGTPWFRTWHAHGQNAPIPNDLIEEHYAQRARAAAS